MVAGQNTDSVWVKRTNGGTAQLHCHIIHDGDTVTSSIEIPIIADYPVYDNISINNSITYPDSFVLSREIVVDSLAGLTWQNKTVFCTPDCRIIIRPGGIMSINHSTLTSACPNRMWQGVEVTGSSTKQQILHNQGRFFMENGSIIENAYTAVRNSLATDNAYSTTGGVIHVSSSVFRNNCRAVELNPYSYSAQPGLVSDYASSFRRCMFIVNNQNLFTANDTVFTEHVRLWDVKGVTFEGCRFTDSMSMHSDDSRGVYAEDAGVVLDTHCDAPYPVDCECPENHATYSTFSGFTTAVKVNTTGNPYPVTLNQVQFRNNVTGASINGNNFVTVTRCDFDLQNTPILFANLCGLHLNNCTGYLVEENSFHRTSLPIISDRMETKGVEVTNSGSRSNLLHRNVFTRLFHGVYATNNNSGLLLTCCSFFDNLYGIYASTGTSVSSVQGSSSEGADNSFRDNMINDFYYAGTPSVSYYYSAVGDHALTSSYGVTTLITKNTNPCTSTLCDGGSPRSLAEFQSDMDTYTGSTQPLSDIYYAAVRTIMSDTVLDLNELEMWHAAAQPIGDPYSLTETRFMEGYAETFAENAEDAETANYADFHALKLALRGDYNDNTDNNDNNDLQNSPKINWYALTPAQIAQLQTIAERNTGRASVMAKGVLCFFHGICYEDEWDNAGAHAGAPQGDDTTGTRAKHIATDNPDDAALSVYPNPTDDLLFIEMRGGAEIANVALYDLQGRMVTGAHAGAPRRGGTAIINVRNVPVGVYVLRVTDADGKEYHRKIVRK